MHPDVPDGGEGSGIEYDHRAPRPAKQTAASAYERLQTEDNRIMARPTPRFVPGRCRMPATKNQRPMSSMKNKVQLVGHVGQDPELKQVGSGQQLLRLSVATNERFRSGDGDWKDDTQWHPVVAWGKQAERLASQVKKGSGLMIEGRLVHRSYETKEGEKRYATEVVLTEYFLLASKPVTVEEGAA